MKEFKLTDITQLDNVTYDEMDNLLKKYEETRVIVEQHQLKKFGALDDPKTYSAFDEFMASMPQTKDTRRRRAIAEQIRDFYQVA